MAKSKLVKMNKKIEEKVVGGYKSIEDGVVSRFNQMTDRFVDNFLTNEGESVADARERLAKEQSERDTANLADHVKRAQEQRDIVERNMLNALNASRDARRKAGLE